MGMLEVAMKILKVIKRKLLPLVRDKDKHEKVADNHLENMEHRQLNF